MWPGIQGHSGRLAVELRELRWCLPVAAIHLASLPASCLPARLDCALRRFSGAVCVLADCTAGRQRFTAGRRLELVCRFAVVRRFEVARRFAVVRRFCGGAAFHWPTFFPGPTRRCRAFLTFSPYVHPVAGKYSNKENLPAKWELRSASWQPLCAVWPQAGKDRRAPRISLPPSVDWHFGGGAAGSNGQRGTALLRAGASAALDGGRYGDHLGSSF